MTRLDYKLDIEKLVNALALFSSAGVTGLSKMKVAKLLYFADKLHMARYGTPITGDVYVAYQHGPIPSTTQNLMCELVGHSAGVSDDAIGEEDLRLFAEYFRVSGDGGTAEIVAVREPDEDVFSDSEIECLDEVIERFGDKSAAQLRAISHDESTWIRARSRGAGPQQMSWEEFIENPAVLEMARAQQDHREFYDRLPEKRDLLVGAL